MKLNLAQKSFTLGLFTLGSLSIQAQDQVSAVSNGESSSISGFEYLLLGVAVVLLIAIAVLGNTFLKLMKFKLDKEKKQVLLLLLGLFGIPFLAHAEATMEPTTSSAFQFNTTFWIIGLVIFLELLAIFFFLFRINKLMKAIYPETEKSFNLNFEFPRFWEKMNASVPIEREADVMLDHDYDGIKELDNDLPPWWKYGFYLSIAWAFGYLVYYHVLGAGPLSIEEYNNDMAMAKEQKDEFMRNSKNNVDENTVVLADASGIAEGKTLFTANCAACHGADGGSMPGGVGPNLVDDYWIHKGDIKSIFKSIKYGWPANGMKSWESDFSPMQIQNLTSYVLSLKGTKPATPKEPQGELEGNINIAATDSIGLNSSDSLQIVQK